MKGMKYINMATVFIPLSLRLGAYSWVTYVRTLK